MLTFQDIGRHGRIGNQMFQIASTIGIAVKNGYKYAFPHWQNYDQLERFGGGEDIDIQKWFANPLPLTDQNFPKFQMRWGFHGFDVPDNRNLVGHMQSEKYFEHCKELIKNYFKFKNETPLRENTIAVHFRGGDYGDNYHPTCTREYYEKAAKFFDKGFSFLLFTDDPERAKEVMPFEYELVPRGHSMMDLELMTRCDAHIIANSTYSWWGAWLADSRRVIAPAKWFGPAARLSSADICPDNWIVI